MTKRPTFKESWLTGEIPGHPIVGGALYNAVLHAREVLAGQQEKTIRKLWDILNTILEKRRSHQGPTPSSLRRLFFAFLVREGASYALFARLRLKKDPDIQRILNEVPEEKVLATLILAEVDRGHVHAAIEAASELDPIQKNISSAEIGSAGWNHIARERNLVGRIMRGTNRSLRWFLGCVGVNQAGSFKIDYDQNNDSKVHRCCQREYPSTEPSQHVTSHGRAAHEC